MGDVEQLSVEKGIKAEQAGKLQLLQAPKLDGAGFEELRAAMKAAREAQDDEQHRQLLMAHVKESAGVTLGAATLWTLVFAVLTALTGTFPVAAPGYAFVTMVTVLISWVKPNRPVVKVRANEIVAWQDRRWSEWLDEVAVHLLGPARSFARFIRDHREQELEAVFSEKDDERVIHTSDILKDDRYRLVDRLIHHLDQVPALL